MWCQFKAGMQRNLLVRTTHLFSGSLTGLRWQMVTSSITACEAGPSRLFTASCTVFWDLVRSCIWVVSRNCRPHASRNLQEATFAFFLSHNALEKKQCVFSVNDFFLTCLPWRACAPAVCSCMWARSWHESPGRRRTSSGWPSGSRQATTGSSAWPAHRRRVYLMKYIQYTAKIQLKMQTNDKFYHCWLKQCSVIFKNIVLSKDYCGKTGNYVIWEINKWIIFFGVIVNNTDDHYRKKKIYFLTLRRNSLIFCNTGRRFW